MNALNHSIARTLPPLVVALKGGAVAWIQHGVGHLLLRGSRQWTPIVDAEGIGGQVLTASEVVALVSEFGRPT